MGKAPNRVNFKVSDQNGNEEICASCDEVIGWALGRKGLVIEAIDAPTVSGEAMAPK
tara:strand:+ start:1688 stop:1858 length:171 start_codon:yes stop_codon:yes gene_type:complete